VRVTYNFMVRPDVVFLAELYGKNEKENLTHAERNQLQKIASEIQRELSETVYHVPPETDVRALRETLGLSQSDFAALFGFNVRSLQDWEQGRRRPEIPIRAYPAVIQRDPQAVIRALRAA